MTSRCSRHPPPHRPPRSRSGRGARPASRSTTPAPRIIAWNGAEPGSTSPTSAGSRAGRRRATSPRRCRSPPAPTSLSRPFVTCRAATGSTSLCTATASATGDLRATRRRTAARRSAPAAGRRRDVPFDEAVVGAGRDADGRTHGRRPAAALVQNVPLDGRRARPPFATLFDADPPVQRHVGLDGATPRGDLRHRLVDRRVRRSRRLPAISTTHANWAPAGRDRATRLSAPRGGRSWAVRARRR